MFVNLKITSDTKINQNNLYNLLLFLFQNDNINHEDVSNHVILFTLGLNEIELENLANSDNNLINDINIQNLFNNKLFLLFLKKKLNTDLNLEIVLIKIRKEIIEALFENKKKNLKKYLDFIIALAEQCWLNEYIFPKTEKEKRMLCFYLSFISFRFKIQLTLLQVGHVGLTSVNIAE